MWNSENLGKDPTDTPEMRWIEVCRKGPTAICVCEGLSILGDAVPDDVLDHVSGVEPAIRKHLLVDNYLLGLLDNDNGWRKIHDPTFKDYILCQIEAEEKRRYHERAIEAYKKRLKNSKNQDSLAAMRLPLHMLEVQGSEAFVNVLLDRCIPALIKHRLVDYAIIYYERALKIVLLDSQQEAQLRHYRGLAYHMIKNLAKAEEMYLRALAICEKLNWLEGMPPIYSDLGYLYAAQGKLDDAKNLQLKALEIDKKLGKIVRIASYYGRLAMVYLRRQELDKAEEMVHKSLKLAEQHGLEDEMGRQYNNLGLVYLHQHKLDEAEKALCKGLDVDKQLERFEGIASKYANLGWVYRVRGDIGKAKDFWVEAQKLFEKLGMKHTGDNMRKLIDDMEE